MLKSFARLLRGSTAARPAPAAAAPSQDREVLLEPAKAALREGNVEKAIALLESLLEREASLAAAHLLLGTLLEDVRRTEDARDHYFLAWASDRDAWEPNFRLGLVALERTDYAEAQRLLARALELGGEDARVYNALGAAHLLQDAVPEAVEHFRKALALDPRSAHTHSNMGYTLIRDLERFEEGAEHIRRAQQLAPDDADIACNRVMALHYTGHIDEALALAETLLARDPTLVEARVNRGLMLLTKRDFDRGWPDYEARKLSPRSKCVNNLPWPEWAGSPLAGRTIFVHSEQGIGDEIMFASCVPDLVAQGARCILECHPKLEKTFRRSFPQAEVVAKDGAYASAPTAPRVPDFKVAAGSLPLFFRRATADFSRQAPGYLRADEARVAYWKARLASLPGRRKVGISWRGGLASTRRSLRSIPLREWLPILCVPDIDFVSVQYADPDGEVEALARGGEARIHHWPEAIEDYDETAALVSALDLVVSVQTAIVHLCGALGRPVWALIPAAPEWRYGAEGTSTPWYASVRLVRQARLGAWRPVIEAVANDLEAWKGAADRA